MKVLLVNPPVKGIFEPQYDLPVFPHTGLAYLAAALEQAAIPCDVIDCKLARWSAAMLLAKCSREQYECIGFTAYTHEVRYVHELAGKIKENNQACTIIIGGPHVSGVGAQLLEEFSWFDIGVIGEGEIVLPRILDCIRHRRVPDGTPGIVYRVANGSIRDTGEPELVRNLDSLPDPAYRLFQGSQRLYLITCRGCPFTCVFCSRQHGSLVRYRSVERVADEFERVVRQFAPEYIVFADENFTIDRERSMELAALLIERGLHQRVEWEIQTHVSLVDAELLARLYAAGCRHICFGIESGNPGILKGIRKNSSLKKSWQAVQWAHETGMRVELNCIIGHPFETYATALDTIQFVAKCNPYLPVFGIMIPYPGTRVASMAAAGEGDYVFKSANWDDYNKQLGASLRLKKISRIGLKFLQLYGYVYVYLYNKRVWDFIVFCTRYRREALAYVRSFFSIRQAVSKE